MLSAERLSSFGATLWLSTAGLWLLSAAVLSWLAVLSSAVLWLLSWSLLAQARSG